MSVIISGTDGLSDVDGSAGTPAIRGTDANTGIFFPAADTIAFAEGGAEAMRIDSSGNVGIGTSTNSVLDAVGAARPLVVQSSSSTTTQYGSTNAITICNSDTTTSNSSQLNFAAITGASTNQYSSAIISCIYGARTNGQYPTGILTFATSTSLNNAPSEKMRITSGGDFLVGKTASSFGTAGCQLNPVGAIDATRSAGAPLGVNRLTNDGILVELAQDTTLEGTISVSGSTVSYNGGNLSRWAQLTTPKDDTPLFKGTVMSNLDEMNEYVDAEGNPVENEQLNKVKVSDVEGDANVAGVFVNWDYDEAHQVDEINMAMTGDMIIRIAEGVTVARGDLLMSAGDGTAMPQGDDIVRSKTIAKVTSTHVTCTYEDGSYCVPCVLMAC